MGAECALADVGGVVGDRSVHHNEPDPSTILDMNARRFRSRRVCQADSGLRPFGSRRLEVLTPALQLGLCEVAGAACERPSGIGGQIPRQVGGRVGEACSCAVAGTRTAVIGRIETGKVRVLDLDTSTVEVPGAGRKARGAVGMQLVRPDAYVLGDITGNHSDPDTLPRWSRSAWGTAT